MSTHDTPAPSRKERDRPRALPGQEWYHATAPIGKRVPADVPNWPSVGPEETRASRSLWHGEGADASPSSEDLDTR